MGGNNVCSMNFSISILRVTISWKRAPTANTANTATIEILVEDLGKDANVCKSDEIGCSEVESKKKCIETCGVGSQGEG